MKTKKYKLSADVDFDFSLIGIVCSEMIYKLSWHLNTYLGYEFQKSEDLIIDPKKQDVIQLFEVFTSANETGINDFALLSNKCENGYLLNQFKNIDFILRIQPSISEDDIAKIIDNISSIEAVISVFTIDIDLLKEKEKQFFIF